MPRRLKLRRICSTAKPEPSPSAGSALAPSPPPTICRSGVVPAGRRDGRGSEMALAERGSGLASSGLAHQHSDCTCRLPASLRGARKQRTFGSGCRGCKSAADGPGEESRTKGPPVLIWQAFLLCCTTTLAAGFATLWKALRLVHELSTSTF